MKHIRINHVFLFVNVMVLLLALNLFVSNVYAGYVEERDIIVIDAKTRAIEGAAVVVEHQLNHIDGILNTTPFFTDATGTASIRFINNEYQEALTDYNYKVYVTYMSHKKTLSITAGKGPKSYPVQLPIYALIINVHDQNQKPLVVNVTAFNITRQTNTNGIAVFAAEDGTHGILVTLEGVTKNYTVTVAGDDGYISIPLDTYNVTVNVIDDEGKKIDGTLVYNNQRCNLSSEEICKLRVIGESEFTVMINYSNKTFTKTKKAEENVQIIIDSTPPVIDNVEVNTERDKVSIYAYIYDPGVNPSGINNDELPYVTYKANYPNGFVEEGEATMLPFANGYSVDLPIEDNCQLQFVIFAKDIEDNLNSYSGSEVIVFEQTNAQPSNNGPIPPTDGNKTENDVAGFMFDLKNIIAVIIAIVLITSVWSFWKRSRRNI